MSVKKKVGSKLAQGVRHVMEQAKTPEVPEQEVDHKPVAPAKTSGSVSKSAPGKVLHKTLVRSSNTEYEMLHPERIWPD